jgi:hypothetical protein
VVYSPSLTLTMKQFGTESIVAWRSYARISDNRFDLARGHRNSCRSSADRFATKTTRSKGFRTKSDIQSLIVRYGTALDTLDADAYAGVFTTDAELDVAGNVRKGRQQNPRNRHRSFSGLATKTKLKELLRRLYFTSSATLPLKLLTTMRRATVPTGKQFAWARTTR